MGCTSIMCLASCLRFSLFRFCKRCFLQTLRSNLRQQLRCNKFEAFFMFAYRYGNTHIHMDTYTYILKRTLSHWLYSTKLKSRLRHMKKKIAQHQTRIAFQINVETCSSLYEYENNLLGEYCRMLSLYLTRVQFSAHLLKIIYAIYNQPLIIQLKNDKNGSMCYYAIIFECF